MPSIFPPCLIRKKKHAGWNSRRRSSGTRCSSPVFCRTVGPLFLSARAASRKKYCRYMMTSFVGSAAFCFGATHLHPRGALLQCLPHLAMPSTSPKRPMYKGLPTFRAGGVTCRTDYLREEGTDHKSALTPTYFSHDHFSSSLAAAKGGRTLYVRALELRLASVGYLSPGTHAHC